MSVPRPPGEADTFCAAPASYIVQTYFVLRMVIAGGAYALPLVLLGWAGIAADVELMGSISSFYYTPARSAFVGIVVALVPSADPAAPGPTVTAVVHAAAAVGFFLLAALSIFFYGQETLGGIADRGVRQAYRAVYRTVMVLVVVLPVVALVLAWSLGLTPALLAVETAALYAFATFWVVKTVELARSQTRVRIV